MKFRSIIFLICLLPYGLSHTQSLPNVVDPRADAWLSTAEIFESVAGETHKGFYQMQDRLPGYFIETHDKNGKTSFKYTDPKTKESNNYDGVWNAVDDQICYYYKRPKGRIAKHCQYVRQYENCLFFYSEGVRPSQADFAPGDWTSVRYTTNEKPKCVNHIS